MSDNQQETAMKRTSSASDGIRVGREEDEIVAYGHIHVERMSDRHIWANLGGVSFDFCVVKGKLVWRTQLPDGWDGIERELRLARLNALPPDVRMVDALNLLERVEARERSGRVVPRSDISLLVGMCRTLLAHIQRGSAP